MVRVSLTAEIVVILSKVSRPSVTYFWLCYRSSSATPSDAWMLVQGTSVNKQLMYWNVSAYFFCFDLIFTYFGNSLGLQ